MELEQSVVSIDVVAMRFWRDDETVTFGIARRPRGPYEGRRALPGVLLGRGARLEEDARRAVTTKLGVAPEHILAVGQLVTFDEPNRDPRGPTLSIAMWAVIGEHDEDTLAEWVPFVEHPRLAFDHDQIVATARGLLAGKLWKDIAFTRALTGETFPATRAVALTSALTGARPDAGNLNRTLAGIEALERTEERTRVRATGRPAAVWRWV